MGNGKIFLLTKEIIKKNLFSEADEISKRKKIMLEAIKTLKPRENEIITKRRLTDKPKTLEELSQEYGVSREN